MEVQNLMLAHGGAYPADNENPAIVPAETTTATAEEPKPAEQHQDKNADKKLGISLPSDDAIKKSVEDYNKYFKATNRRLDLSVHKKTGHLLIKVVDNETGDVVREIPPEKNLEILAGILERAGVLVNRNA